MRIRPPPEPITFFLDRSIGKTRLAGTLRGAGARVEIHDDHLPPDGPDEAWLELCGARGWVVLTVDRLRERPNERDAVRDHAVRVIVVRVGRMNGEQIGMLLVRKLATIRSFCASHPAPFLAVLSRNGLRAVDLPRRSG